MPTHTWKGRERKIAKLFGTERTPLSGGNSKQTRSDTLHPRLFVEAKHRRRHPILESWASNRKRTGADVLTLLDEGTEASVLLLPCRREAFEEAAFNGPLGLVRRKAISAVRLFHSTTLLAAAEGKIPLVVLTQHRKKGAFAIVNPADVPAILKELRP